MAWKYIMVKNVMDGGLSFLVPVIFPDKLVHADVYRGVRTIMPGWSGRGVRPVSAGRIEHIAAHGIGGDSETLGVSSDLKDADIIRVYSYMHGMGDER